MRGRRIALVVAMVVAYAGAGLMRPPVALAADAVSLSVSPATVAPGQSLTFDFHLSSLPSNFPLPQCQKVNLVSIAALQPGGWLGLLAVTNATGLGDFTGTATVPSGVTPGTYTVEAQACNITWASTTFVVVTSAPSVMSTPSTGAAPEPGHAALSAILLATGSLTLVTTWRRRPRVGGRPYEAPPQGRTDGGGGATVRT